MVVTAITGASQRPHALSSMIAQATMLIEQILPNITLGSATEKRTWI